MENQFDRLLESGRIHNENRDRASQILNAVEGMCIWEARELLGACADALEGLTIPRGTPHTDTAQQHVDDAFVDEIWGKIVSRLEKAYSSCGERGGAVPPTTIHPAMPRPNRQQVGQSKKK